MATKYAQARKLALESVVSANEKCRVAAGMLRRIGTDGLTHEEWNARYMARARGERVPRKPELTKEQWARIASLLERAITYYTDALKVARLMAGD